MNLLPFRKVLLLLFYLLKPFSAFHVRTPAPFRLYFKFQRSSLPLSSHIICQCTTSVRDSEGFGKEVKHKKYPTSNTSSSGTSRSINQRTTLRTNEKLERDLLALRTFFDLYGHLRVPYYYIIPNGPNAPDNFRLRRKTDTTSSTTSTTVATTTNDVDLCSIYPVETHGLRLGLRVARIRKGEVYVSEEQRTKLLELGLFVTTDHPTSSSSSSSINEVDSDAVPSSDDTFHLKQWSCKAYSTDRNFNIILSALQVHDQLYGDMLVPRYFVVPSEEPWPSDTWGLQLGNRVRNIRQRRAYNKPRYHEILTEAGFVMDLKNISDELKISRFSSH